MIFTVKIQGGFRACTRIFEEGNRHNSIVLGISDEDVMRWYKAGFIDVEGLEIGPLSIPGAVEIDVEDINLRNNMSN